jgi:hypothetical protein
MFPTIAKVFKGLKRMCNFSCTRNNVDEVYDPSSGVPHSPKDETGIILSSSLPDVDNKPSVVTDEDLLRKYIQADDKLRKKLREEMSREQLVKLVGELKKIRNEINFRTSCYSLPSISINITNVILIATGVVACGFFPPLLIILSAVGIGLLVLSLLGWYCTVSHIRETIKQLEDTLNKRTSLGNH